MKRLFLLLALVCAAIVANAADVYKWTDKDGVVHYSDAQPPADAKAERVPLAGMAKKTAAAGASANDADEAATPPKAAPPTLVTASLVAQKRCEQARTNLEVLQGNSSVALDNGKSEPMTDQARAERIAVEQRAIADNCK